MALKPTAVHGGRVPVMDMIATRVAAGETVAFRPTGSSMVPLIRSRQMVTVSPVHADKVEVGDIVLCRVAGATYLHLVSAVDAEAGRVQISNNRGRVNGWTSVAKVFGICTAVDGRERPRLEDKSPHDLSGMTATAPYLAASRASRSLAR